MARKSLRRCDGTTRRELSGATESELAAAALSAPPAYLDGIVGADGAAEGVGQSQQTPSQQPPSSDDSADTLYRMLVSLLESDQYYKVLGAEVLFQLLFGSLMLVFLLFGKQDLPGIGIGSGYPQLINPNPYYACCSPR
jgi:hypothetical protein